MNEQYLTWTNYSGLTLCLFAAWYILLVAKRRGWESTRGKIQRSGATREVSTLTSISENPYNPVSKYTAVDYVPHLDYTYKVNGTEYSGKKLYSVNLLPITTTDLLPIICGSERPVYFDPSNPKKSFLLHSPLFSPIVFFLLGALLAGLDASHIEILSDFWHKLVSGN